MQNNIEQERIKTILNKIQSLPLEKFDEVENFIDFVSLKAKTDNSKQEHKDIQESFLMGSAKAFAKVWNNKEDETYDKPLS